MFSSLVLRYLQSLKVVIVRGLEINASEVLKSTPLDIVKSF